MKSSHANQINWDIVLPLLDLTAVHRKKKCIEICEVPDATRHIPRIFWNTIKETHQQFRALKSAQSLASKLPIEVVNCEIGKHLFHSACLDFKLISNEEMVVMDQGTHSFKIGFSGERYPTYIPQAIAHQLTNTFSPIQNTPIKIVPSNSCPRDSVGSEAEAYRGVLTVQKSMSRGIVDDWDNYEKILYHSFYHHLKLAPQEHPFHATQHLVSSNSQKEKMAQIVFETFNVAAFYLSSPHSVALYATKHTCGAIVDIGDGSTIVNCMIDGYSIGASTKKISIGGSDITEFFAKHISCENSELGNNIKFWREIKEASLFTYIPSHENEHFENSPVTSAWQNKNQHQTQERLPLFVQKRMQSGANQDEEPCAVKHYNGGSIYLSLSQRNLPVEILFYPQLIGLECVGIHQLIFNSIMSCDIDTRKELFQNVILIGGTALIPGLSQRMQQELQRLVELSGMKGVKVKVTKGGQSQGISPSDVTFVGTGVLTSMPTFQQMWISREEYNERGPPALYYRPRCW